MGRDHRKLRVFALADALAIDIYRISSDFPASERFGLQAQLRRAVVSTATNIVEGSARRTTREYVNFLNIAAGSGAETAYLLDLSARLGFVAPGVCAPLLERCAAINGSLNRIIATLSREP